MADLEEVVTDIATGVYDGSLGDIADAIVGRVKAGAVKFPWRMRFEGDEWTQQSVTLGELKFAENHCHVNEEIGLGVVRRRKATFQEIDPRTTAEHAVALLVAHLHKAQGQTLDEAMKRAEAVRLDELGDLVTEYEVPGHPKDGEASSPSTTS